MVVGAWLWVWHSPQNTEKFGSVVGREDLIGNGSEERSKPGLC